MKKLLLFIAAVTLFCNASMAQSSYATDMTVSDTIRNTTATTAILKSTGGFANYAIQVVITKVSGTVAGTAKLYGSLEGVNYVQIATDTLALANVATNTKIWVPGASKYLYYKVNVVGVGTMKATMKGYFLGRAQ